MYGFAIPDDPADLALLLGRMSLGLKGLSDVLEISHAELARLDADAAALEWAALAAEQARREAESRERYVSSLVYGWTPDGAPARAPRTISTGSTPPALPGPGIRPRLYALLDRLVLHECWTREIGMALGLQPLEWTLSRGSEPPHAQEPGRLLHENEFAVGKASVLDEF